MSNKNEEAVKAIKTRIEVLSEETADNQYSANTEGVDLSDLSDLNYFSKNVDIFFNSKIDSGAKFEKLGLYYIICLSKDQVYFKPEFIFLYDLGLKSLAGISVIFENKGYGDPYFPNYNKSQLRSVESLKESHILHPANAGEIIVKVKGQTPELEIISELSKYGDNIKKMSLEDFYTLKVKYFHESEIIENLISNSSIVESAQKNTNYRINDISPGWKVVKVA